MKKTNNIKGLSKRKILVCENGQTKSVNILASKSKAIKHKKSDFRYILYVKNDSTSYAESATLSEIRERAIQSRFDLNQILIYRKNIKTNIYVLVHPSKYAFKNKLYYPSKSVDGTGFYYEWSWEKKNPFEQPQIKALPDSYTAAPKEVIIENAILKKVTFWQLAKRYIGNIFD